MATGSDSDIPRLVETKKHSLVRSVAHHAEDVVPRLGLPLPQVYSQFERVRSIAYIHRRTLNTAHSVVLTCSSTFDNGVHGLLIMIRN